MIEENSTNRHLLKKEWVEDIVQLGKLGRKNSKRITMFEEINASDGLSRMEGSDEMRVSIEYLLKKMVEAELEIFFDDIGNIYGVYNGSNTNLKKIATGSHLDSVFNGGMFDGVVGVVAALEALRRLKQKGYLPKRSIVMCVFMGEEGSTVLESCVGSQFFCGKLSKEEIFGMESISGENFKKQLEITNRINSNYPIQNFKVDDFKLFLELHIEQGPVLENNDIPIGIVNTIYGIISYKISVDGVSNHAGSTPMDMRYDPLYGASQIISTITSIITDLKGKEFKCVVTFDTVGVYPNSPSIIPNEVVLTVDARSDMAEGLSFIDETIRKKVAQICSNLKLEYNIENIVDFEPVSLDANLIKVVQKASSNSNIAYKILPSGAIHDALHIAKTIPTSLIFVQSKNGISHSPFEWSTWEHIDKGVEILTTVLENLSNDS